VKDPIPDQYRVVGVTQTAEQNCELVTADASHEISGSYRCKDSASCRFQHLVAGCPAEPVVHDLEAIEVHQEHGKGRIVFVGLLGLPDQLGHEEPTARQTRQAVEQHRAFGWTCYLALLPQGHEIPRLSVPADRARRCRHPTDPA